MTAGQPATITCPQCGQIDQLQKVSAIVKAGTTTGALTGTTTGAGGDTSHTLARDSQTLLSKLLASPKKPSGSAWPLWQYRALQAFVVVMFALAFGLVAGEVVSEHSDSTRQNPQFDAIARVLLIGLFFCLFGIIALVSNRNRAYKKAREKWKQTYYCHRCDGFFRSGDTKTIAPEYMQKWLRARKWKQ